MSIWDKYMNISVSNKDIDRVTQIEAAVYEADIMYSILILRKVFVFTLLYIKWVSCLVQIYVNIE